MFRGNIVAGSDCVRGRSDCVRGRLRFRHGAAMTAMRSRAYLHGRTFSADQWLLLQHAEKMDAAKRELDARFDAETKRIVERYEDDVQVMRDLLEEKYHPEVRVWRDAGGEA